MNINERELFEANLSAILDGELDGEEMRKAIDALICDRDLRQFWAESREMHRGMSAPSGNRAGITPREDLWENVLREASPRARVIPLSGANIRVFAAAATILLAVGLSLSGVLHVDIPFFQPEQKTIQLAGNSGSMSEDRFIELTTELLQADPRYHRKMLEVMQTVNQQAYGFAMNSNREEEPPRNRSNGDQPSASQASNTPTPGTPASQNSELNLW